MPGDPDGLDVALEHALRDRGALDEVGAELRHDPALRGLAHEVPGPADALEPAGDPAGRLHADDEVDAAHVDAELERARRYDTAELAVLQRHLDPEALLARHGPVMRSRDVLRAGELVDHTREALRGAPVVHEHEGRPVRLDQLEEPRLDPGPGVGLAAQRLEVLDRALDEQVRRLARAGVHDLDGPRRSGGVGAAEEPGDLVQRPDRRREPDPLEVAAGEVAEALEGEREMRAALRPGDGVDLVDDHVLDRAQHVPRAG